MEKYMKFQQGLLKTLMVNQDEVYDVMKIITVDDFQDERYKAFYQAILDITTTLNHGEEFDLPSILQHMIKSDVEIEPDWVLDFVHDSHDFVRNGRPKVWAKFLKIESVRLQGFTRASKLIDDLSTKSNKDPLEVIGAFLEEFTELSIQSTDTQVMTADEIGEKYEQYIEDKDLPSAEPVPSPYPKISKTLGGGWLPSSMITVGARTGVGKTVVAVNSLLAAAKSGKSVLMFSLEMTYIQIWNRLIASETFIPIQKLEGHSKLTDEEEAKVREANTALRKLNILIDDTGEVTMDYITSVVNKQKRSSEGCDMVIVDYLQLVTPAASARNRTRQEEVAVMSRRTKILAKTLGIPIMVLVQLNRKRADEDSEVDTLPRLDDIKESGAIALDSDAIILIHRTPKGKEAIQEKASFIIAKNRHGESGGITSVNCLLEYSTFKEDVIELAETEYSEMNDDKTIDDLPEEAFDYDPFESDGFDEGGFDE